MPLLITLVELSIGRQAKLLTYPARAKRAVTRDSTTHYPLLTTN